MNQLDTYYIDEYLLGRLKGEELESFEQKMNQEPDMKAIVDERKALLVNLEAYGEMQLKARINRLTESSEMTKAGPKIWLWVIGLIVLGALLFAIWQYTASKQSPPDQLYAAYFEPYPLNFGSRGDDFDKQLAEAGSQYQAGNYSKALPIFEAVVGQQAEPQDGTLLAMGVSYLALGQSSKASEVFQQINNNQNSPYKTQALWYMALSNLQMNNTEACKKQLQLLLQNTQPKSKYFEMATELLSKLPE